MPADAEVIDLAQLDEDDEDRAIDEADFVPSDDGDHDAAKRKADQALGPACPICGERLEASTSNQKLNDHVDMCLNKDAIYQASKATPKKAKRPKNAQKDAGDGNGMLQWLHKGG